MTLGLIALIGTALLFDFLNGLHDSANSIATIVSTRVMPPLWAVLWASFFNFIAFMVFGLHVANTVGNGLVAHGIIDQRVVFAALSGAICWNIVTWLFGIPSSSSHALIGGLIGGAMAKAGPHVIIWSALDTVAAAIVGSPAIGFALALILVLASSWIALRATPFVADRRFRWLQLLSSALLSLGHGGNDAQKTMGLISVLLYSAGLLHGPFHVPVWVVLACQSAMALGTMSGGWKIVRTVGARITDLKPMQGFCAETGGALALFGATALGIPVSTTHTMIGSIVGVGSARRTSAVRWIVARQIVVAWFLTLPAACAVSALCYYLTATL